MIFICLFFSPYKCRLCDTLEEFLREKPIDSISFANTDINQPQTDCQNNHRIAERDQSTVAYGSLNINQKKSSTIDQPNCRQPLPNNLYSSEVNTNQIRKENITANDDTEPHLTNENAYNPHNKKQIQPTKPPDSLETIDLISDDELEEKPENW